MPTANEYIPNIEIQMYETSTDFLISKKKIQVHMCGIFMDLYERIMNMQLITSDEYKNILRELISDRFESISIILVKPQFCCILVFLVGFFKFNNYFFILKITNILHCIKIESKIKSIKPRRINTIGLLILICISITLHPTSHSPSRYLL